MIIVYGLNAIGYRIFCLLRQQGARVIGVNDVPLPDEPDVIIGPLLSAETLSLAGITRSQVIVLAHGDDAINLDILLQARLLNPNIRIINRLFNDSLGDRLDYTLPEHTTMSVSALAAPIFAFSAMGKKALGHLKLFSKTWPIYEELVDVHHPWCHRRLSELWDDPTRMLIHYLTSDEEISLVEAMSLDRELQPGDRLIIGTAPKLRQHRTSWQNKLLKIWVWLGEFQQNLRSGLLITLVLLSTIAIATVIYVTLGWPQASVIDSIYFSVGMITGAGGNEGVVEKASALVKLLTVIMMLVGAGVVGVFYALLNDLVLGTRLRHVWDVARVPHQGHYVICGLGGVGLKTIHELKNQDHEVVVIEPDANNRFLCMARSQGIPVILADARLPITLKTANIERASALLALTNNDMTNLEIALTARELSHRLPVVVRSNHPTQAERVQRVFDFTAVLNPFDIAAPSFAATALGGCVLGSGVTGNILWIALSLLITPAHPFCDRTVESVAIEADLVPLYLNSEHRTIHGWDLLAAQLKPGDVLHLTIPAKNIERLWWVSNIHH